MQTGWAQSGESDASVRRITLDRAEAAHGAGRHDEALLLAERAGTLQMTPSLRFFIARENSELNRHAAALLSAQECVREAQAAPAALAGRETIAQGCREIAQAAQARVATLLFVPPTPEPAGLEVRVRGQLVRGTRLALPFVVDPGAVAIEFSAPGYRTARTEVAVAAGANAPVPFTLEREASASPVVPANVDAPREPPPVRPRVPVAQEGIGAGPFVLLGVGGAALVGSLATWLLRGAALEGCAEEDVGTGRTANVVWLCDTTMHRDNAASAVPTLEPVSGVLLGVGAAATVAGGAWAIARAVRRGPSREEEREALRVAPTVNGVALTVRWGL